MCCTFCQKNIFAQSNQVDECELFNFMKPVASSVGFWCFEEWGEPGIGIPVFRYPPKWSRRRDRHVVPKRTMCQRPLRRHCSAVPGVFHGERVLGGQVRYTQNHVIHTHTHKHRAHTHTSKYTVFHATNMVFLYNYLTHCSYHTTAFTLPFEDSFGDRHSFRPSKMPKKSQLSQHSSGRPRHRRKPLMWATEGFISSSHNIFMYSYMHSYVKKCIYIYTYIFYDTLRFVFMIYFLGVGLELLRSFSLMADGKSHRHT